MEENCKRYFFNLREKGKIAQHTHTHTRSRARAHTRTHTHTHSPICLLLHHLFFGYEIKWRRNFLFLRSVITQNSILALLSCDNIRARSNYFLIICMLHFSWLWQGFHAEIYEVQIMHSNTYSKYVLLWLMKTWQHATFIISFFKK